MEKFLKFEIFNFVGCFVVAPIFMIVGLHDRDWLHVFGSSLFGFVINSSLLGHVLMHFLDEKIDEQVYEAPLELEKFSKELNLQGLKTDVSSFKEAKISRKEKIENINVQELFPNEDIAILSASIRNIRIKTLQGEIKVLKQIKARISDELGEDSMDIVCLSDEVFIPEDINVKKLTY